MELRAIRYYGHMEKRTMEILNEATKRFYASQAESFSASRRGPWAGWRQLDDSIASLVGESDGLAVLDLACGNLRFESHLLQEFPQVDFEFYTVDATPAMLDGTLDTHHFTLDLVERLILAKQAQEAVLPADIPQVDLAVCNGFLHHIPSMELRAELLHQMIARTRPGGIVACTFWCFGNSQELASNAAKTTPLGLAALGLSAEDLEPRDHLLGWQGKPGVYRYSHDFSDEEIDELLDQLGGNARVETRFVADGRGGNLNTYAVLRVGE